MDIPLMTAKELAESVRKKHLSATEVTKAYLTRIRDLDPQLGCFLKVDESGALAQAEALDQTISHGQEEMPLLGVPIAVKDMIVTKDLETTAGSKILKGFVPPYDSTVVSRLRKAGAIIVGKTNMDEFAMGSSTENSAFFPSRNPWDTKRVPGGSSGGSAAAVVADLCPLALGTDTGGSIRQPASLCGITGMKPTYGRVSRYGIIAYASSLDQVGPFARTAEDVALLLQTIGGHDPLDATSIREPLSNFTEACKGPVKGLRIGVPEEYFAEGLDPQIRTLVKKAIEDLTHAGAKTVPISLPLTKYAIGVYYMIATAEASSNLARYDGVRYGFRAGAKAKDTEQSLIDMYEQTRGQGFGAEVKRRIMLGTYVLRSGHYDAYYKRASQVRTLIRQDFLSAFEKCDVIATPTSPILAFQLGEKVTDPLAMYLSDIYTISCNLAGIPGISIPCGFANTTEGSSLPIGLQLLGPPLGEATLLRCAAEYQRMTDHHKARPLLSKTKTPTEVFV